MGAGQPLKDLGTFAVSGVNNEGNISTINPASLTSFVQGMGSNNLLTLLLSYQNSADGQWRIATREATATTTNVLTGAAGDFAAFLQFDVVHQTSGVQGDYNDDGTVNAADYTVWRDTAGDEQHHERRGFAERRSTSPTICIGASGSGRRRRAEPGHWRQPRCRSPRRPCRGYVPVWWSK